MAVRRAKDSKGNIIRGVFLIDTYPAGRKGKREIRRFGTKEKPVTEVEALAYEKELRRTHNVPPPISPKITDAVPDFLAYYGNDRSKGTIADFHVASKKFLPFFGHLKFTQLTPGLIEQYKAARLADTWQGRTTSKSTINRELSYLSSIITWATENDYCHPLPFRIRLFPKKQTKAKAPQIHTVDEMERIIAQVPENKRGLVLLMYDAGLRRTEATTIQRHHVDLDHRFLRITGKGDKERIVPIMTERLFQELTARCKKVRSGYLYINPRTKAPYKDLRTMLRGAADRAGADKHIYHHLLRHNWGSHAAMAGVSPEARQRIMGHADLQTGEIYTHLAQQFLVEEGKKFRKKVERPPPKKPDTTQEKKQPRKTARGK